MSTNNGIVKVGLGVIIEKNGKILIGQRVSQHAPYYSIPGGHLELGETFEQGAIREIKEETNLDIVDPTNLPQPPFNGSQRGVQCYLDKIFY